MNFLAGLRPTFMGESERDPLLHPPDARPRAPSGDIVPCTPDDEWMCVYEILDPTLGASAVGLHCIVIVP